MIRHILYKAQRLLRLGSQVSLRRYYSVLGFYPKQLAYYELAMRHSSASLIESSGFKINNERLEFLGDSVLSTAISKHLYLKHPLWDEGEMSKRRSALVKRTVNNAVAESMGLDKLLNSHGKLSRDAHGDALEALIGAIFLDRGYEMAERFVLERVLPLFQELETSLVDTTSNYKSRLLEWTQHHHFDVEFQMLVEPKREGALFVCAVCINGKRISIGRGTNKKLAHQEAAHLALDALQAAEPALIEQISALRG